MYILIVAQPHSLYYLCTHLHCTCTYLCRESGRQIAADSAHPSLRSHLFVRFNFNEACVGWYVSKSHARVKVRRVACSYILLSFGVYLEELHASVAPLTRLRERRVHMWCTDLLHAWKSLSYTLALKPICSTHRQLCYRHIMTLNRLKLTAVYTKEEHIMGKCWLMADAGCGVCHGVYERQCYYEPRRDRCIFTRVAWTTP